MKTLRLAAFNFLLAITTVSFTAHAADIDIYSGGSSSGAPNVLIVLDTAARDNATLNGSNCAYADGTAPSLGATKAFGAEQCALVQLLQTLTVPSGQTATLNVGLMVMGSGANQGGYLYQPIIPLVAGTDVTSFIAKVKALDTVIGNENQAGAAMQESWAYYTGSQFQNGISGTNYSGFHPAFNCKQNFIIYIGSAGNNSTVADNSSAGVDQKLFNAISQTVSNTSLATALKTQIVNSPATKYDSDWADEWTRFMSQPTANVNYGSSGLKQSIITYSIAVFNPTSQPPANPDTINFMLDMAISGGGKPYTAASYNALVQAMLKILNEVQAVNSVFASSSLPVSVNTQGTYLNQIYMGMFRPDGGGNPRWLGNLKQYQFIRDPITNNIELGDNANPPQAAVSSSTGFVNPNAISFWTNKNTAVNPDLSGGFWKNQPNGVGGAYDLPDGELVEKGGAAQQLRTKNLLNDYTQTPGSTSNPRNLYVYCPSGTSCVADLTNAANVFDKSNTGISANAFGSSTSLNVTSIVRNGTTAVVTTQSAHGLTTGNTVTIIGADQPEYNVTSASITVINATSFSIAGLPDFPTTPSTSAYTVNLHAAIATGITSITRTTSNSATNTETATVTTSAPHGFLVNDIVAITNASPSNYNGNKTVLSVPSSTTFTFSIPVYPTAPAQNTYKIVPFPTSVNISSIVNSGSSIATVTTSANHGFHTGQTITISTTPSNSKFNGTFTITVTSSTKFTYNFGSGNPSNSSSGTATTDTTGIVISAGNLTRNATTSSAQAIASGITAGYFANGDKVNIVQTGGSSANESAYVQSAVTISCVNISGPCTGTSISYPIPVTPTTSASGASMQVAPAVGLLNISAGNITRSGTTATVSGIPANVLANGNVVDIAFAGTPVSNESAYTGTWTIACSGSCTSFTISPVTLTPATPATGTHISAIALSSSPPKDNLIDWVRGSDNNGDEKGPGAAISNVRPSIHGDVLHSRPVVINYGGATNKIVVYYGSNDGIFHAVNGNQTGSIGSTAPGNEMWGLILPEFFGQLNRQRTNSPALLLPSTPNGILPAPQSKDYFVDGPTGVYQTLKADGTADKVYLYLTMRRGGNFIYGLDVSDPTKPKFMWKIDPTVSGFAEMGQTWSRPRIALVKGYTGPVLIFGGGYDSAEDMEPPGTDSQGRGIFVVDATTGALVWSASPTGASSSTHAQVSGMNYSIPSDVTLIDRDHDGYVDRIYGADTGGNIWRVDTEPTTGSAPGNWKVTKLAALGCTSGVCATGTTPRKFFFPPSVVTVGTAGLAGSYDAVLVGSGDREHPLYSTSTNSAYQVQNQFYMLKDVNTGKDAGATATTLVQANLVDVTSTNLYDGSLSGFYFRFGTGEKSVNAAVTQGGTTFFGTNQPSVPDPNSCGTNLGTARSYAVDFSTGKQSSIVLNGGGLPPSPTAGMVTIGTPSQSNPPVSFCIGCVTPPPPNTPGGCKSAIENCYTDKQGAMHIKRTYWYKN